MVGKSHCLYVCVFACMPKSRVSFWYWVYRIGTVLYQVRVLNCTGIVLYFVVLVHSIAAPVSYRLSGCTNPSSLLPLCDADGYSSGARTGRVLACCSHAAKPLASLPRSQSLGFTAKMPTAFWVKRGTSGRGWRPAGGAVPLCDSPSGRSSSLSSSSSSLICRTRLVSHAGGACATRV